MKEKRPLPIKAADYIKIPKDFTSLHDLKELIGNYDLVTRLTTALNNYNRHYLDSYLMNVNEVLAFIPESQWYDYKISCRGSISHATNTWSIDVNSKWDDDKKKIKLYKSKKYPLVEIPPEIYTPEQIADRKKFNIKDTKRIYFKVPLNDALINYIDEKPLLEFNKSENVSKEDKIFIVNSKDKTVEVVMWALNKPDMHYKYSSITYDLSKIEYELDKEKNLTIKCNYSYTAHQTFGGVWISTFGGNGYLRGGTTSPYTINGYDIYKFCTRTNLFLGYFGFKEDEKRARVKKTSAW